MRMAEDKAFRLVKEIPALFAKYETSPAGDWVVNTSSIAPITIGGWEKLNSTGLFFRSDEIDLQGIMREEKTLFFASNYTQRADPYQSGLEVNTTFGGVEIIDRMIVSDVPLKDIRNAPVASIRAGFGSSPDDYMTVKLAEGVVFVQTINAPNTMVMTDSYSFASGDPTASDKLYLYRWVQISRNLNIVVPEDTTVIVPAKRYVATGISTEEPELVWMMRLKRSFEIQESAVHESG